MCLLPVLPEFLLRIYQTCRRGRSASKSRPRSGVDCRHVYRARRHHQSQRQRFERGSEAASRRRREKTDSLAHVAAVAETARFAAAAAPVASAPVASTRDDVAESPIFEGKSTGVHPLTYVDAAEWSPLQIKEATPSTLSLCYLFLHQLFMYLSI